MLGVTTPMRVDETSGYQQLFVRFEVKDSGSGLLGADPDRLFQPFEQGVACCIVHSLRSSDNSCVIVVCGCRRAIERAGF